jgi:predicted N-acyltransferase
MNAPPLNASVTTRVLRSFADVDPRAWDALVAGHDNPFLEHAFLHLLETSGSLGKSWQPRIVVASRGGDVVGALPAFRRTDSFGEFIFDWQLAEAASRFGISYYPKLTIAVPFTPATGPRVLLKAGGEGDGAFDNAVRVALFQGVDALVADERLSSVHMLYCNDDEASAVVAQTAGALRYRRRSSLQFHWRNNGYGTFDDFLGCLDHGNRKQIKRERRRVQESGLVMQTLMGHEVPSSWWPRLYALYAGIYDRKWGSPYLTKAFFERIGSDLGDSAVVVVAKNPAAPDDDNIVAMTLSFERGAHCYGRYWGTDVDVPGLHFELCYYALIERAIATGQRLVEAGAQGEHKLKRGYLPVITHSAHAFVDERFGGAVARFYEEESRVMHQERDALALHGPFKDGGAPPFPLVAGISLP